MIKSRGKTSVIVIRHPKEKIAKCSLRHLHDREEFTFLKARPRFFFDATNHILLSIESPTLSPKDNAYPLLLLDSTWRLLPSLFNCIKGKPVLRSLHVETKTAYPRISKVSVDPQQGLASIEALFVAKRILGEEDDSLLDGYYWKEPFLRQFSLPFI